MIELLLHPPAPSLPSSPFYQPIGKKQNKTLEAGAVISSKWAFKIGGEWIYICHQHRLWLVSRRRCWIYWSDACFAGTTTFRNSALPTASEKQLVRWMNERMSGYFPQEMQTLGSIMGCLGATFHLWKEANRVQVAAKENTFMWCVSIQCWWNSLLYFFGLSVWLKQRICVNTQNVLPFKQLCPSLDLKWADDSSILGTRKAPL